MLGGLEKKKVNYYNCIRGKTNANRRVSSDEMDEISHLLPCSMMKHTHAQFAVMLGHHDCTQITFQ